MSYDLGIFYSASPLTAQEAARQYVALCTRPLNAPGALEGLIEPDPSVAAFVAEMMTLYPPRSSLDDEVMDFSPWSCDPDVSGGHVIVSVRWSRCQQMAQTLTEMAWEHGLVVYSPQDDKVYPPPGATG